MDPKSEDGGEVIPRKNGFGNAAAARDRYYDGSNQPKSLWST